MMFKIDEQIAHWSQIGLEPGDMLGSGTPGGVAAGRKPGETPWWLKRGDVVECEVEKHRHAQDPYRLSRESDHERQRDGGPSSSNAAISWCSSAS